MKKHRKVIKTGAQEMQNPVAKYAHLFNKALAYCDKSKYCRKAKHSNKGASLINLMRVIKEASLLSFSVKKILV